MARIPVPVVGQVGPRVVTNPRAGMIGDALQNLGQTGMRIAGQAIDQQQADQAQAQREAAAEAKRQAAEEKQQREAANRAQATAAMNGLRDGLTDLHDELQQGILDGTVPKDKAAEVWQQRAKDLAAPALEKVTDQAHRGLVQQDFDLQSARLGNRLRRAVTQRDREDVTAGINQTLESLGRQYQGDPEATTAKAMATLQQLGPHSTLKPDQLAKLGQQWKENTQYTAAFELVNLAKNDGKLLTAAEKALSNPKFADLDPQKRAVLVSQIDAHRTRLAQQAEIAAARADRAAAASLRKAEAEFQTFQTLADKGTALSPEYIDRVTRATAGTPYQAGIKAVTAQIAAVGGLAAQSIPTQQATLDAINVQIAKQGRTPELEARRQQVEKVLKGSRDDLAGEPLRAGLERGVITDLQPLNFGGGIPGLLQQITGRVQQANTIGQWAGKAVSPLLASEAEQMAKILQGMPTDQRAQTIATLSGSIGAKQAQAMALQMDNTDRPLALALAAGSSMTTAGRPTSTLILKGQQALKDKAAKITPEDTKDIAAAVGESLSGKAREDVIEAASLILAAQQVEGGANAKRAVRLAVGGDIIDHNGARIPIGGGMTPSEFKAKVAATPAAAVQAQATDGQILAGGQPVPMAQFMADLPDAQLQPAGQGRYFVRAGGALVTNSQRRPITIEVK